MMHALSVGVFRDADGIDCTNSGISSRYDRLLVLCDDGNIIIPEDKEYPENLCRVVKRHFAGRDIYHIEPVADHDPGCVGWMSGGNYAASSDMRFARLIGDMYGAVSIHDRQESQALYDAMSH